MLPRRYQLQSGGYRGGAIRPIHLKNSEETIPGPPRHLPEPGYEKVSALQGAVTSGTIACSTQDRMTRVRCCRTRWCKASVSMGPCAGLQVSCPGAVAYRFVRRMIFPPVREGISDVDRRSAVVIGQQDAACWLPRNHGAGLISWWSGMVISPRETWTDPPPTRTPCSAIRRSAQSGLPSGLSRPGPRIHRGPEGLRRFRQG